MMTTIATDGSGIRLPSSPLIRAFGLCVIVLIALSTAIGLAGRWFGHAISMGGHTDDSRLFEIVIGNNVIVAPANTIRFDHARRDGIAQRLDLYLRWPDLTGYSDAYREDFNSAGQEKRLIFVSYEPRIMSRDMSGRLEPIYRTLIEKTGRSGPDGLTVHDFIARSGYVNEELVIGARQGQPPFVARCLTGASAAQSLAQCQRDVGVGDNLSLSYRFPASLLSDWRKLDSDIAAKSQSMIRTAKN